MTRLSVFALLVCCGISASSKAQEADEDFSRQELFSIVRDMAGEQPFSLPNNFGFPDDARSSSTFGIDFSHHNISNCKCSYDWSYISRQGVKFVYLKASQGVDFVDRTVKENTILISKTSLNMGVYHFLSADKDASKQWSHFEGVLDSLPKMQLPPSLDLEWDVGPWRDDCPSDAIIRIRTKENNIIRRCDKWGFVKSSDIISKANTWIRSARAKTGKKPVIYTAASWWNSRIGEALDKSGIESDVIWIADYSARGKYTEKPRTPAGVSWTIWQFTDGANLTAGKSKIKTDASIFDGSEEDFLKSIGAN